MDRKTVASLIDHTLLKPEATASDIRRICSQAREFRFASVCVNPYWTALVAAELKDSGVKTCIVAGFPLGANLTAMKVAETAAAVRAGAQEIDMVINVGELLGGNYDAVRDDIAAVVNQAADGGAIVKVILETCLLPEDKKTTACLLAKEARAAFVKTSTGFNTLGARVEDVALMRRLVGPAMGVKASGGIRTLEDLEKMVAAGASRVGASASVRIVESAEV